MPFGWVFTNEDAKQIDQLEDTDTAISTGGEKKQRIKMLAGVFCVLQMVLILSGCKQKPQPKAYQDNQRYVIHLTKRYYLYRNYETDGTVLLKINKQSRHLNETNTYSSKNLIVSNVVRMGLNNKFIVVETSSTKVGTATERAKGIDVNGKAYIVVTLKNNQLKVLKDIPQIVVNKQIRLMKLKHYQKQEHF